MPPTWQDDLSHPWCKGESLQELRGSVSRNEPWVPHQTLQELNIIGHTLQLSACGHTYKEATHVSMRFLQDLNSQVMHVHQSVHRVQHEKAWIMSLCQHSLGQNYVR